MGADSINSSNGIKCEASSGGQQFKAELESLSDKGSFFGRNYIILDDSGNLTTTGLGKYLVEVCKEFFLGESNANPERLKKAVKNFLTKGIDSPIEKQDISIDSIKKLAQRVNLDPSAFINSLTKTIDISSSFFSSKSSEINPQSPAPKITCQTPRDFLEQRLALLDVTKLPKEGFEDKVFNLLALKVISEGSLESDCGGKFIEINLLKFFDAKTHVFYDDKGNEKRVAEYDQFNSVFQPIYPIKVKEWIEKNGIEKLIDVLEGKTDPNAATAEIIAEVDKIAKAIKSRYFTETSLELDNGKLVIARAPFDHENPSEAKDLELLMEVQITKHAQSMIDQQLIVADESLYDPSISKKITALSLIDLLASATCTENTAGCELIFSKYVKVQLSKPLELFTDRKRTRQIEVCIDNDLLGNQSPLVDWGLPSILSFGIKKLNSYDRDHLSHFLKNSSHLDEPEGLLKDIEDYMEANQINDPENFKEVVVGLQKLSYCVTGGFFSNLGGRLREKLTFPPESSLTKPTIPVSSPVSIKEDKPVKDLSKYLSDIKLRQGVTPKLQPLKIKGDSRNGDSDGRTEILDSVFDIKWSVLESAGCLIEAVGSQLLDLPGQSYEKTKSLEAFKVKLKQYISDNKEECIEAFGVEDVDEVLKRLTPKTTYTYEDGYSAIELYAASQIFQRPVYFYSIDTRLKMDVEDNLQPSMVIDNDFSGEPIYIFYTRGHYAGGIPKPEKK